MAKQVIDVGTSASDGTGDPLREAFTKINENFTELYSTVENEGLTYGNISSNVAGVTFNVTRYTESYAASPVLEGTGQVVGNVYLIRGNVLGGTTPLNDVLLTVTSLANVTVGNIATVSAVGVPVAPVLRVNGLTGNVDLTVNNIPGAASKAYVNAAIAANIATVTGNVTNSLNANITAANAVISNHTARIATLESNSAAQASQINNLVSVKANVSYVDTSIDLALSSNAILANVQSVNANVAAANAAILLRANLSGAAFTGNISANAINATNAITTNTYMIGGSEAAYGLTIPWGNPAAMFFGNSAGTNNKYYQINLQNLDPEGSGDIVVTSDDGADTENYIALGISGSQANDPLFPSTGPHDGYVYINGGNLDLQSNTGNIELIAGNLVTGQVILTTSNILKLGTNVGIQFADGTLQSTAFGGNTNVASINANITAANAAITALQANAAAQALDINSLTSNAGAQATTINTLVSNAAAQATSLNSINANVGAYQTFANANAAAQATSINSINANVTAANINITALLSNAAIQAQELDNLIGNAQSQQGNIIALQSNSATQGTQINLLNANISAANTNITALTSNSATQGAQISLLNANVSAANVNISNLQTNAATQALQLDNLQTNVNTWYSSIAATNANVAAANARIVVLDANLGSTSTNVSALQNNVLNLVANKANVSGSTVFSGNLTASYLLANNGVKVGTTVEVGDPAPVAYPDLAAVFVGNVDGYYQLVLQNLNSSANASGDIVITADDGDDTNYFLNLGINSSNFSGNFEVPAGDTGVPEFAHDSYVTSIGGNLFLRTDSNVYFVANTVYAGLVKDGNFTILNTNLEFSDGSVQSTAVTDVPGLLANIDNIYNDIITIDANIGSIDNYLDYIEANIGSFQTYANLTFAPDSYTNANVQAYLAAFDGNIVPSANVTYDLGTSSNRWRDLWLSGNTIHLGDATLSVVDGSIQSSIPLQANITASNITVSGTRIDFASGGYIEETEVLDGNLQPAGYYGIAINSSDDGIISLNALDSNSAVTSSVFVTNVNVQLNVANSTPGGNALSWYFDNVGNLTIPGYINYANGESITSGIGGGGSFGNADVKIYLESLSNVNIGTGTGIGQSARAIAIGEFAGNVSFNVDTIAIGSSGLQGNTYGGEGYAAGGYNQGPTAVAIGTQAGAYGQGGSAVAIGTAAGARNQYSYAVAIGEGAGQIFQLTDGVAIGRYAGYGNQGEKSIAMGESSGWQDQGTKAVAIGWQAGGENQGAHSVAIGSFPAYYNQGTESVAIGREAGTTTQGNLAIAIGKLAGNSQQGIETVAIGHQSGNISQQDYSIAIGSTGGYGDDYGTGGSNQGSWAVAIGAAAGSLNQGPEAIALGDSAGYDNQGNFGIAVGVNAGFQNQASYGTAIGASAGSNEQGSFALAVGFNAGYQTQGGSAIALGDQAGKDYQGTNSVSIGHFAGYTSQGAYSVALGASAGYTTQGNNSVAIGESAGGNMQANLSVAIGSNAGYDQQGNLAIAIGPYAGNTSQSNFSIAIGSSGLFGNTYGGEGYSAGAYNQGAGAVAIGVQAGAYNQGASSVAIGDLAGIRYQNVAAVAIGPTAASFNQGISATAVGGNAGYTDQGTEAVAIGSDAAYQSQGVRSIAIGKAAGYTDQGTESVAIGREAGTTTQGNNAIAIGLEAGYLNQAANSIVISTQRLDANTSGFFVDPVSNKQGNVGILQYVGTTKEIVYSNAVTVSNLTITGNTTQQSAYYETYSNVTNSGGNLTCNFVNGSTFYASLGANVTANFTNVVATTGTVTGVTIIVDQGATAYGVSNIQINSGTVQTVKWAGGTTNVGTANNTDIMSFSLINLGSGAWRVLGAISNYG